MTEAWKAVQDGYYIARGGYLISLNNYCAFGTLPNCIRAGSAELDKMFIESRSGWEKQSFKDLILRTGYYPGEKSLSEALKNTIYFEEALLREKDMIDYMIDSNYSSEDFHNPFRAYRVWKDFFDKGKV